MTFYWAAQIVGGIAFLVGITMFFNRNERGFKFQLAGYSTIMCVHFFMLGANAAGMSVLLSAIRTIVSIWWRNVWIMVIFIILPLIFATMRIKHPVEILPIAGAIVSTWAMFRTSGLKMRSLMWCSTACWVIHNVWAHSIGGTLIESSFLVMNGFNIIRFYRMQKRGIDPFAVESRVVKEKEQSEEADTVELKKPERAE
ncbi:membrane protein [Leminorella grimontii]|uniref:Membrane protein n=1 Tax=Leminorella grimontii TaxID=82981 RepID=A0AAV5N685_9GAMM|nr:YgjV family protein [Leminorella grimontii]KFC92617.1 inner membrane protein [Leminorella grimontii ATCC 33999 = DSM 5078]GKX57110.1 membrane protein [Leminorella grimontii]VFS62553.1 Inner membrane protein ygjV [Leminorella grimontii]